MKKTVMNTLLSLSVLTPALAAGNCEPGNAQLSTVQRTAYVRQCLAESSAPANATRVAQQNRKLNCEQNARNMALQGTAASSYVTRCMTRNEARDAALSHKSAQGNLKTSYANEGSVNMR